MEADRRPPAAKLRQHAQERRRDQYGRAVRSAPRAAQRCGGFGAGLENGGRPRGGKHPETGDQPLTVQAGRKGAPKAASRIEETRRVQFQHAFIVLVDHRPGPRDDAQVRARG
ncbi:hypothetical protein G6F57_020172 [Rhizopus arrhizus]|nr:hypothetical protein G6F31_020164 [Rhizopus arrhizus]KAG1437629.1 hypothetical protein G6F57_020172 [Rhizopus arrhizus]